MKRLVNAISSLAALMALAWPAALSAQTTDYTFRECLGSSMHSQKV